MKRSVGGTGGTLKCLGFSEALGPVAGLWGIGGVLGHWGDLGALRGRLGHWGEPRGSLSPLWEGCECTVVFWGVLRYGRGCGS